MKRRASMMMVSLLLAGAGAVPAAGEPGLPSRPWADPHLSADARADALVRVMTREEKLTLVFGYFATDFADKNYKAPPGGRPGSAGYVPGIPRLGVPAQYQTDAGLGVATQALYPVRRERTALPSGLATASSWNVETAYRGGAMIGDEARRSGFNVMLAGGANLAREPRNGRNFEYAGEDPLLAGTIVGAQIAGIQSNHIISTIKHFALNDQETDRFLSDSVIDRAAMRTSDLLAFQIAIERGDPGSVMCAYNKVGGTYACEHPYLLTDVLRRDWGWKGYVMTDWGGAHSTVAAADAGLDQESGFPFDTQPFFGAPLRDAVAAGTVSEARLTEMARRIVYAMFAHGVFDHPAAESPIDMAAHASIARRAAAEGAVLLKNDGALLPLSPATKRIVVIGGHADRGVLAGEGSSLVFAAGGNAVPGLKPRTDAFPTMYYPSSPLDEIRKQAPGAMVTFVAGTDRAAAVEAARRSDVAIVFATQWSGEAFDTSLSLDDDQDALIAATAAANPRTVVVLETGNPVTMPWSPGVPAILEAWFPGTQGGAAIADILFGRVDPSGRLPITFPAGVEQLPHPEPLHTGEVRYTEGATVGYKWFDATKRAPLFPFGHGLSYTTFDFDRLTVRRVAGSVRAAFTVRNTGRREGAAVAQLYVSPVDTTWEAPQRLGGFGKVRLAPGETRSVSIDVDPRLLAVWDDARGAWRIAGGRYRLTLGASSRDVRQTATIDIGARTIPAGRRPEPSER